MTPLAVHIVNIVGESSPTLATNRLSAALFQAVLLQTSIAHTAITAVFIKAMRFVSPEIILDSMTSETPDVPLRMPP
ncbi:MAG: hypothetical protein IPJ33_00820 [Gammaproteobacteria bacterium]|nr:hypothetical protein [Gammaproteobacteria bacterium]